MKLACWLAVAGDLRGNGSRNGTGDPRHGADGVVGGGDLLLMFIHTTSVDHGWAVRIPLYIGVVALARYLVLDVKAMDGWRMLR